MFDYDAIIVGGGPPGLTTSIYLARACYRVLVLEKGVVGLAGSKGGCIVQRPALPSCKKREGGATQTNGRPTAEARETNHRPSRRIRHPHLPSSRTTLHKIYRNKEYPSHLVLPIVGKKESVIEYPSDENMAGAL